MGRGISSNSVFGIYDIHNDDYVLCRHKKIKRRLKMKGKRIVTTAISVEGGMKLLQKIEKGESVSDSQRLKVIQDILAFSPRDWSDDDDLWLLWQVALNGIDE